MYKKKITKYMYVYAKPLIFYKFLFGCSLLREYLEYY